MEIYIINQIDKILPAFIKANRHILQLYREQIKQTPISQKSNILEELWLKEFNVKLQKNKNNNYWDTIKFDSEIEKTLFLLKWN